MLSPESIFAKDYFMRADGTASDRASAIGPCSVQSACMSIGIHNFEWKNFSFGDVINICTEGGIFKGIIAIGANGLTYQAAGENLPVIDAAGHTYGFYINGVSNITLDRLIVKNADDTNVYVNASDNFTLKNSEIAYAVSKGIVIGTNAQNHLIEGNRVHHNGLTSPDNYGSGIFVYKANGLESNQSLIRFNQFYLNADFGIYVHANNWIVEYNRVFDNGNTSGMTMGIEFFNGDNDGYGQNLIARFNHVWGTLNGVNDGSGIAADDFTNNVEIYGNICSKNDGPGIGVWRAKNVRIHDNITFDNSKDSSGTHTTRGEIAIGAFNPGELENIVVKNNVGQALGADRYAVHLDAIAYNLPSLEIDANFWFASAVNWYFWKDSGGSDIGVWNQLPGIGNDKKLDQIVFEIEIPSGLLAPENLKIVMNP